MAAGPRRRTGAIRKRTRSARGRTHACPSGCLPYRSSDCPPRTTHPVLDRLAELPGKIAQDANWKSKIVFSQHLGPIAPPETSDVPLSNVPCIQSSLANQHVTSRPHVTVLGKIADRVFEKDEAGTPV